MSFVIGLCMVLGLVAGGLAYLLFRRRVWIPPAVGVLVFAGSLVWFLTPVCVAIPADDLARFNPPIETRTDTGMVGQRYFQQRDGAWFHCKARIARQLFF
jgi:hypothetical protein